MRKWFTRVLNDTCIQMRHVQLSVLRACSLLHHFVCLWLTDIPLSCYLARLRRCEWQVRGQRAVQYTAVCVILSFWSSTQSNFVPSWIHWPSLYDWSLNTYHSALWLGHQCAWSKAGLRSTPCSLSRLTLQKFSNYSSHFFHSCVAWNDYLFRFFFLWI